MNFFLLTFKSSFTSTDPVSCPRNYARNCPEGWSDADPQGSGDCWPPVSYQGKCRNIRI